MGSAPLRRAAPLASEPWGTAGLRALGKEATGGVNTQPHVLTSLWSHVGLLRGELNSYPQEDTSHHSPSSWARVKGCGRAPVSQCRLNLGRKDGHGGLAATFVLSAEPCEEEGTTENGHS